MLNVIPMCVMHAAVNAHAVRVGRVAIATTFSTVKRAVRVVVMSVPHFLYVKEAVVSCNVSHVCTMVPYIRIIWNSV